MPDAMRGLRVLVCAHSETTAEDGEGYAVCMDCKTVVRVRLTYEMLKRQIEALRERA